MMLTEKTVGCSAGSFVNLTKSEIAAVLSSVLWSVYVTVLSSLLIFAVPYLPVFSSVCSPASSDICAIVLASSMPNALTGIVTGRPKSTT